MVGFIAPLLRSVILGMPKLFPTAVAMAFKLATYGIISGLLYKCLPKKKINIYVSLIASMVSGRLVWDFVQLCLVGFDVSKFSLSAFWAGAVANAIPGIIIQIVFIPVLVMVLEGFMKKQFKK